MGVSVAWSRGQPFTAVEDGWGGFYILLLFFLHTELGNHCRFHDLSNSSGHVVLKGIIKQYNTG